MGLLDLFRSSPTKNSAKTAKERLQVIIAHERSGRDGPDYLPRLKEEILDVIRKYVAVSDDQVQMQVEHLGGADRLELNITLTEADD